MTKSREWFQDDALSDEDLLARCNEDFRRGPVGLWSTYGDELTLFGGLTVLFAADGTGIVYFWDVPYEKDELKTKFHWRSDRDFEVILDPVNHANPADRWGRIRYEFRLDRDGYRNRQVMIVELDSPDEIGTCDNFLWSVRSLHLLSLDTDFENLPGEDV